MNPLQQFYTNAGQREAVKAFLIETLKEVVIEKAFDGEDVWGMPEAKASIERAFNKLEERFGKVEEPKIINSK